MVHGFLYRELSFYSSFILSPKLARGTDWAYFLLEVFTSTLEVAGRKTLKSISKQFSPLLYGLILNFPLWFQLLLLGLSNRLLLYQERMNLKELDIKSDINLTNCFQQHMALYCL